MSDSGRAIVDADVDVVDDGGAARVGSEAIAGPGDRRTETQRRVYRVSS